MTTVLERQSPRFASCCSGTKKVFGRRCVMYWQAAYSLAGGLHVKYQGRILSGKCTAQATFVTCDSHWQPQQTDMVL